MSILLNVDISKVKTSSGETTLLSGVNFNFNGSGVIWIQGGNGSGKSLISSIISGKAFLQRSQLEINGEISLRTLDNTLVKANSIDGAEKYSSYVSYWPQRVGESLISLYIQDDLCSGLEGRLTKNQEPILLGELQNLVERFDLNPQLLKNYGQCSYGETRRIELATALTSKPSIIVADEPFSGLDEEWKKTLLQVIEITRQEFGALWIITGHSPPDHYGISADLIKVLPDPPLYKNIFENISKYVVNKMCLHRVEEQGPIEIRNLIIKRKKPKPSSVKLRNFNANEGSVTILQGKNGSGKTTISHVLGGLIYQNRFNGVKFHGAINGDPYKSRFIKAPRDDVKVILQNPFSSYLRKNVLEDLQHPLCPGDFRDQIIYQTEDGLLHTLEQSWGRLDRQNLTFSFGQLRFLQFLLIPISAQIVIFDEPYLGIHQALHCVMDSAINGIASSGRLVIVTKEVGDHSPQSKASYTIVKEHGE